jgi:putative PIN family toxin of toxin-antitoxin system
VRIVLDTNILVSALLSPSGPPFQLLSMWESGDFELVISRQQRDEVARVLGYKHLSSRISAEQAAQLVTSLEYAAVVVGDLPSVDLSSDPADNLILASAVAGQADLVVTGDKRHLLAIGAIGDISIVSATEAVQRIQANRTP